MTVISSPRSLVQAALVQDTISALAPKWTLSALACLRRGDAITRTELQRQLPGFTGSLHNRIIAMERSGLVTRSDSGTKGSAYLVHLTEAGRGTNAILRAAVQWGATHLQVSEDTTSSLLAERTLASLRHKHTAALIWELENDAAYPSEIFGVLPRDVSSTALYTLLGYLVHNGLVTKTAQHTPARSTRWQFELTDRARDLGTVFQTAAQWSRTHRPHAAAPHPPKSAPFSSPLTPPSAARTPTGPLATRLAFSHSHRQASRPARSPAQPSLAGLRG